MYLAMQWLQAMLCTVVEVFEVMFTVCYKSWVVAVLTDQNTGLIFLCIAQQWEREKKNNKHMNFIAVIDLKSPPALTVYRAAACSFYVFGYLATEILTHPLQDL